MSQNVSSAVMQQRHEAHDSLDDFPTPPWATRALIEHVLQKEEDHHHFGWTDTVWEPACNRGYMARPLAEYCFSVRATDIHDYGFAGLNRVEDFLMPIRKEAEVEWIITNPPFRLAAQFAARCRDLKPHKGYALLVRSAFLEGVDRYETLFKPHPPAIIAQFVERVPMVRGRHDPSASTATSYTWLVWLTGARDTKFIWIPPCRRQLQRADDA
jgi:hypothetical protein